MPHDDLHALPLWDPHALTLAVGDNPGIHRRLLAKYLASARTTAQSLADAAAQENWQAASEAAHRLKSASRAVGAMRLGHVCEALERQGRSGVAAGCAELAAAVAQEFAQAAQHIEAAL
jgi:HPt (histidine-containing phosphotransfer) domain-containing protein